MVPVALFVYNRSNHLEKTLDYLKASAGADKTDLYIFSDGPKNESDRDKVEEVRNLIASLEGSFKSVNAKYRNENYGLARNVIEGVTQLLSISDSAIVLEDDITVSADFLKVMNGLLEKYREDKRISSISGYMYPLRIPPATEDFFLLPRASSWGWATWRDRWANVDWNFNDFEKFRKDKRLQAQFNQGGADLTEMLLKWKYSMNDSWAVRWGYHHTKTNTYGLFPKRSMVLNHGNDGSGTHSKNLDKFDSQLEDIKQVNFPDHPSLDLSVLKQLQKFFKVRLHRKIINRILFLLKTIRS